MAIIARRRYQVMIRAVGRAHLILRQRLNDGAVRNHQANARIEVVIDNQGLVERSALRRVVNHALAKTARLWAHYGL
jgi:hypothetical protein